MVLAPSAIFALTALVSPENVQVAPIRTKLANLIVKTVIRTITALGRDSKRHMRLVTPAFIVFPAQSTPSHMTTPLEESVRKASTVWVEPNIHAHSEPIHLLRV